MDIQNNSMSISQGNRRVLIILAIIALLGPNGMYLYYAIKQPELNQEALGNPVSLAFMIEAMMLLGIFLWYVFLKTGSWLRVFVYLALAFLGSLAFSFPLFLYRNSRNGKT